MRAHKVSFRDLGDTVLSHWWIRADWGKRREIDGREISEGEYEREVEMSYEDAKDDVEAKQISRIQKIRKHYDELQRFKKFNKAIEEAGIDLVGITTEIIKEPWRIPAPSQVAEAYYEYEAAEIFRYENLEQIVKIFGTDKRFDVLQDINYDTNVRTRSEGYRIYYNLGDEGFQTTKIIKLESKNLRIEYYKENDFGFGTERLEIKQKNTRQSRNFVRDLHTDSYSQNKINKIIKFISENV